MANEELPISVQTDKAWSELTRTMARRAPRHLHNAQTAWRKMRQLRRGR